MIYNIDKEKIITHFGMEFYSKILNDLDKHTVLWDLSELEQIDYYSVNCIFKCVSNKHGLCVLKIGNNPQEVKNEYNILSEYSGTQFCRVYEADIANSVLLIELIMPGTQLRAETSLDKRLDIFHRLSQGLHKKPALKENYPTYIGWVSQITEYMRNRKDHKMLYEKMAHAEQVCRVLCDKYHGEMLLHGDLHHDNILLDGDNNYRIIDPKGVIGDVVFDIPRFILNEFDDVIDDGFQKKYMHITKMLSKKFIIPEYDIRKLTYVEMCMGNCWNVEDGEEPDIDCVLFAERMMNEMEIGI
jgi:streptomycin 6-kinase